MTLEKMQEQIDIWRQELDAMETALRGLLEQRERVQTLFGQLQGSPALAGIPIPAGRDVATVSNPTGKSKK